MKKLFLLLFITPLLFISCSSSDDGGEPEVDYIQLDKVKPLSLSSESTTERVALSKDISGIATANIRDYNSDFIRNIKTYSENGKTVVSFNVEENRPSQYGYREGYIDITQKDKVIGTIEVYQARPSQPLTRLVWATSAASYSEKDMKDLGISDGLEMTKFIFNLDKTTNGSDNYKNYPAFAYCIEMNRDPENNMEWHLPSDAEMDAVLKEKGHSYFGFKEFWTSHNFDYRAVVYYFSDNKVQTLSKNYSKKSERYVYAVK